jgi:hypothetical protein
MTAAPLSPDRRARLAALAEVIAPRWNAMPSAGDINLAEGPVDRALQARPDLVEPLARLLDEINSAQPQAEVERLSRERPTAFWVLMQVVAGAYYMDAGVRAALGYAGQRRKAPG